MGGVDYLKSCVLLFGSEKTKFSLGKLEKSSVADSRRSRPTDIQMH